MKTLFETYEEISKHKDKWCYYTDRDLEIGQAWKSVAKSNSFIHTYFERGGKEVFDIKNIEYFGFEHERDIHTVSTFVLGIGIAETLEWNLVWNELFIWFLMCLYHDMGYKIEDNAKYVDKYKTLRAF